LVNDQGSDLVIEDDKRRTNSTKGTVQVLDGGQGIRYIMPPASTNPGQPDDRFPLLDSFKYVVRGGARSTHAVARFDVEISQEGESAWPIATCIPVMTAAYEPSAAVVAQYMRRCFSALLFMPIAAIKHAEPNSFLSTQAVIHMRSAATMVVIRQQGSRAMLNCHCVTFNALNTIIVKMSPTGIACCFHPSLVTILAGCR
jgi:hypothetical protein